MKKTILVVAGPTAVGKTAIAIALAKHFDTAILSADSRQCYRELNIGVAKPSAAELAAVPHYFINSHSISEQVDAAAYEQYALTQLQTIFAKHAIAVVAGGTGLYIKALCEGLDQMPAIPPAVREEVRSGFYGSGISWLQEQVQQLDPLYYNSGEIFNPHRLMRALEFVKTTGKSIRSYQKGQVKERDFDIIKIGLELPRETLYDRINQRVETMLEEGLLAEVTSLEPFQQLTALQTVGYRELFDYLNGLSSLEAAIEFIKRNTRQYAKRQLTWFKKDAAYHWFSPTNYPEVLAFAENTLAGKTNN